MEISKTPFGKLKGGRQVELYTLMNNHDMVVKITNYGGIITSIIVPDKTGRLDDIVLGYDSLDGYLQKTPYFGAIVGRYGNRIGKAQFVIGGTTYMLAKNNGPNSLHGGLVGFDKVVWQAQELQGEDSVGLRLDYLSPDMEEGFPGNLDVKVTYTLTNDNELRIDYRAITDKFTHVNLTNHSYFNLKDGGASPILDHKIAIFADSMTPVDANLIPTGKYLRVDETPFDFRELHTIGERIESRHQQLAYGGGYDHNFVVKGEKGRLRPAAWVKEAISGRVMEVYTSEPGVQFYTGNFLDGSIAGKGDKVYGKRHGFCLETQHFPDSPNKLHFPSTLLSPGDHYRSATVFKFETL